MEGWWIWKCVSELNFFLGGGGWQDYLSECINANTNDQKRVEWLAIFIQFVASSFDCVDVWDFHKLNGWGYPIKSKECKIHTLMSFNLNFTISVEADRGMYLTYPWTCERYHQGYPLEIFTCIANVENY